MSKSPALARAVARLRPDREERARRNALDSALRSLAAQARTAKTQDYTSRYNILNVALFFLVAERDIQSLKKDALTHPDPWMRKLALRQIMLTLHELDFGKAAGRRFRDAVAATSASESQRQAVLSSLRDVGRAQERARRAFNPLRNAVLAHRDGDGLCQYDMIQAMDATECLELVAAFYDTTHKFISAITKVVESTGTLESILAEFAARERSASSDA